MGNYGLGFQRWVFWQLWFRCLRKIDIVASVLTSGLQNSKKDMAEHRFLLSRVSFFLGADAQQWAYDAVTGQPTSAYCLLQASKSWTPFSQISRLKVEWCWTFYWNKILLCTPPITHIIDTILIPLTHAVPRFWFDSKYGWWFRRILCAVGWWCLLEGTYHTEVSGVEDPPKLFQLGVIREHFPGYCIEWPCPQHRSKEYGDGCESADLDGLPCF